MKKRLLPALLLCLFLSTQSTPTKAYYYHNAQAGEPGRFVTQKGITYWLGDTNLYAFIVSIDPAFTDIVIPAKIEERFLHSNLSFSCPKNATSLTIEEGVKDLAYLDITNCLSLEEVYIHAKKSDDDENAYQADRDIELLNCPKLHTFFFSEDLKNREIYIAVSQCPKLNTLTISSDGGNTILSHRLEKNFIDSLIFPQASQNTSSDHTYIKDGVTYNKNSDDKVSLSHYGAEKKETFFDVPENVVSFSYDENIFADNMHLELLFLPSWVEHASIEKNHLKAIEVSNSNPHLKSIDGVLFDKSGNFLQGFPGTGYTEYTLPLLTNKVSHFYSETLTRLSFPEGMKTMPTLSGYRSFQAPLLETIYIPSTISDITPLYSINLPGLKAFEVAENNPYFKSINGVLYSSDNKQLLYYPGGKENSTYNIPEGVAKIHKDAFAQAKKIDTLCLPASVKVLSSFFSSPAQLPIVNIHVNENNTSYCSIDGVLYSKDKQRLIFYPPARKNDFFAPPVGIIKIENGAFKDNVYLQTVHLPLTLTTIDEEAFMGCSALKTVAFPPALKYLGNGAFSDCQSLEKILLPKGISSFQENAFSFTYNITETGHRLLTKEKNTFSCLEIHLPSSITYLPSDVFLERSNAELLLVVEKNSYAHRYAAQNNLSYRITEEGNVLEQSHLAMITGTFINSTSAPLYTSIDSTTSTSLLPSGSVVAVFPSKNTARIEAALGEQRFYISKENILLFSDQQMPTYQSFGEKSFALKAFNLYLDPAETSMVAASYPKDTQVKIIRQLGPWYHVAIDQAKGYVLAENILPHLCADLESSSAQGVVLGGEDPFQTPVYVYPSFGAPVLQHLFVGTPVNIEFCGEGWYKIPQGYIPASGFLPLFYPVQNG